MSNELLVRTATGTSFLTIRRYTHRVAISNHRLVNVADGKVTFRWKDYAHGSRQRTMAVGGEEFLRRFLLHLLPRGFVRIRFFGFLANRRRTQPLPLCQRLLEAISHQSLQAPAAGETKLPCVSPKSHPPPNWPDSPFSS